MTLNNHRRFLLPICILLLSVTGLHLSIQAQQSNASNKPSINSSKLLMKPGAFSKNALPAARPASKKQQPFLNRPTGNTTCNTSTFYMHLTAGAGKKMQLAEVQTMADGNYLLAGNITLLNTEQEGLLTLMANTGNILIQKQVRINNRPTTIFNLRSMVNGQAAIAGIVHDNTDKVFVAVLNSDLSVSWLKTLDIAGTTGTALDILPENRVYFAAQAGSQVSYMLLGNAGTITWSQVLTITGLDNVAGIGHNLFEQTLSANCTVAGKKQVKIFSIDEASGNLLNSALLGNNTEENLANKVTSFNGRIITTGVTKQSNGNFVINRQIMYDALNTETLHKYLQAEAVGFNVSSAQDVAGGGLGFCFPASGKLLFITHFAYYSIAPEHSVSYNVPIGAMMAGVTRSTIDGGFLLALNTGSATESILIKTDSIGTLPGCNFQNVTINYSEDLNVSNTLIAASSTGTSTVIQTANITENSLALSGTFDCNQVYCPPPPVDDTCLATYFKILKSNSYVDAFGTYHLMKGNKHIMTSGRYNNELGDVNRITYGLKLFDERGNFLKGNDIYDKAVAAPVFTRQVDDQHVMVIYYSLVDTVPSFTFTLVDDNLQVIWSKSIKTFKDNYFFGSGTTSVLTSDQEGNIYFYGITPGYFEKANVMVYKMDANGNLIWHKYYEIDANSLLNVNATTTASSLIMVIDGRTQGSVSLRIDKATGKMLNAYNYQNDGGGVMYTRLVKYDGDRVYYAGNDVNEHLVTGVFDSTARPIRLISYGAKSSIARAATENKDKLYVNYSYFDGVGWKDVLLKCDKDLKAEFANEYDAVFFNYPVDMAVSPEGNIYVATNYSYGGVNGAYFDPMLLKYDANGKMGTCTFNKAALTPTDINLQTRSIGFREINLSPFTNINLPLDFVNNTFGQQVVAVICSSTPTCNTVKISGTNKLCVINQPVIYHAQRNPTCTIRPGWVYDTSMVLLKVIDDSTAEATFKKFGATWIKVELNAGCKAFTDSMLVNIQPSPGSFSLGNDTAICKGSTVQLNAGSGFNSYLWQDGSTSQQLTINLPGTYSVTVGNVCGDIFKDTIIVQEVVVPLLGIGNDTAICKGDTLHLSATPGFTSYEWAPAPNIIGQGGTVNVVSVQNIAISAIATTAEGCKAYDTIALSIKTAPVLSLGKDTSFCFGDSALISAGNGYQQYLWSNGAVTPFIIVKQTGNYSISVIGANGCKAKDTVQVQVFALPQPSLGNDINLCQGAQQQLDAGSFNKYLWQDGSTGRYFVANAIGSYWVTVTDTRLCVATDTIKVKAILPLPSNFLQPVDSICQYENITISALSGFAGYLWSTGAVQPAIIVNVGGTYTLTVTDQDGCKGTDEIIIVQKDCFAGVYIPTAFTPNADSKNDIFKATVYGSPTMYRLDIFNRFGQIIFTTADPAKGWDGTHKGVKLPTASFVWQCTYQFPGQLKRFKKGNVVMIR